MLVLTYGIIPLSLKQAIRGDYSNLVFNLFIIPMLEVKPYMSYVSLIDIGIPKRGGKYLLL
jgi:hypothetical protein